MCKQISYRKTLFVFNAHTWLKKAAQAMCKMHRQGVQFRGMIGWRSAPLNQTTMTTLYQYGEK